MRNRRRHTVVELSPAHIGKVQALPSEPQRPQSAPVGAYLLLAAATLLYIPWMTALVAAPSWDEPGSSSGEARFSQSWAELLAFAFGIPLWLALGALVWLAWRKGRGSRPQALASAIVYALAAAATLFAAGTLITWPGGWSIFVPALLAPLLALYGLLAVSPKLVAGRARFVPVVALGLAALVALLALPFALIDPLNYPARLVEERRRSDAEFARRNAASEAAARQWEQDIGKLGPDSPLSAWLEYVNGSPDNDDLHEQAVDGARKTRGRQADAIALLDAGQIQRLSELWRFDLAATPPLCAAYDRALNHVATSDEPMEWTIGEQLEKQLPNIQHLLTAHCDLSVSLTAAETRARKVAAAIPAFERWAQFATTLAALRSGP
jgi:hypothetical protein